MEISVDALESLLARARRSLKESLAPLRAATA
jgi:DNA-directed RNA polymerase specialized sigma24 family protein